MQIRTYCKECACTQLTGQVKLDLSVKNWTGNSHNMQMNIYSCNQELQLASYLLHCLQYYSAHYYQKKRPEKSTETLQVRILCCIQFTELLLQLLLQFVCEAIHHKLQRTQSWKSGFLTIFVTGTEPLSKLRALIRLQKHNYVSMV